MSFHAKVEGFKDFDAELGKLEIQLRGPTIDAALKKASKIIVDSAKSIVRRGDPQKYSLAKRNKKRLRETIGVVMREYSTARVAVVGPQYPAGAHGHLLEFGHRVARHGTGTLRRKKMRERSRLSLIQKTGRWATVAPPKSKIGRTGLGEHQSDVQPYPFLEPATSGTKAAVESAIITELRKLTNGG